MATDSREEIRRRYDRLARGYDRRWARYVVGSARETLRRADLPGAGRILDVGCGTGTLLAELSQRRPDALLAGVDLSPAMLAVARAKLGSRAHLALGEATALPFRAGGFDLALSASALHYWRDPAAALSEIRRVLQPEGSAVITDWCADGWLERLRDRVLRRIERAHCRVHRSAELAALLEGAGFRDVRVERYRMGPLWGMMTGVGTAAPGAGGTVPAPTPPAGL